MTGLGGPRVAIIGAGLTGLTAAWKLRAAGMDVQVFDKAGEPGGRTMSVRRGGFVFDAGAITMLPTYVNTVALAHELGLAGNLHHVTPVIGIPRDGTIHRLDLGKPLASLLTTKLLSAGAKLRLLRLLPQLLRTWTLANFQSLASLAAWDSETISDYVTRVCGEEVETYVAGPIIRGNTLNSTRHAPFGELLWMLRQYASPTLLGFDNGINLLAETLAGRLPVTFGRPIGRIEINAGSIIIHGAGAGSFHGSFDACVLALPPKDLLVLAPTLTPRQRAFLEEITPLRSVSLHVGLSRRPAATETFILPPEPEQKMLTTIVMDHLKAPGRAPPAKAVLSFFVSEEWGAANFARSDDAIRADILQMALPFVGNIAPDIETWIVQRWPYAIIKSGVGLYGRIRDYEADIDPSARVQMGSDFLSMGIEAAVTHGMKMAENLIAQFAAAPSLRDGKVRQEAAELCGSHEGLSSCPILAPSRHDTPQRR